MTELVLARLRARYEAISDTLALDDTEPARGLSCDAPTPAAAGLVTPVYLASLLCFGHFHDPTQIEAAIGSITAVELPAGAIAMSPDVVPQDLLLVLRGALDVSIRRRHSARRVRLAGPGRFVGHVGALDGRPSPLVAHAREPVVLLRLPASRVRAMLRDPSLPARRFSAGLAEDIARALRHAERPIARVAADPMTLLRA
jgi:CRP-like cAMP-binding protein